MATLIEGHNSAPNFPIGRDHRINAAGGLSTGRIQDAGRFPAGSRSTQVAYGLASTAVALDCICGRSLSMRHPLAIVVYRRPASPARVVVKDHVLLILIPPISATMATVYFVEPSRAPSGRIKASELLI